MEGELQKWTNYMSWWKPRRFVLKNGILSYYTEETVNLPKNRIHLSLADIIELPENDLEFQVSTGDIVYYLKANTKEDKLKWIQALKLAKQSAESQSKQNLKNEKVKELLSELQNKYSEHKHIAEDIQNILNKYNNNDYKESISQNNRKDNECDYRRYANDVISKENEEFFFMDDNIDNDDNPNSLSQQNPQNIITSPLQTKQSFYDPLYTYEKRKALPSSLKKLSFNVWEIFKGAVGKDIHRFSVPVFLNEPLSMLQKLCENFQYAYCLNNAANEPDPHLRLAYLACFCIGGFTMNTKRAKKFFNPLLFETFEYIDNEQNFRYFAEQVSHHPAISAFYAEGDGWTFFTNNNAIVRFLITGKLEIDNVGKVYVTLSKFNDNIVFTKPTIMVRNLIFGTMILDIYGKFQVTNENGDICEVDIEQYNQGKQGNLKGVVKDIFGNVKYTMEGNWLESIKVINQNDKSEKVLWTYIPSDSENNYYYQPYTFDLNNLTDELRKALPPTDSRFRPDQRMMEDQNIDKAAEEKMRLEEKQRQKRKENEKKGITVHKPMYFEETYDDLTGELIYRYNGKYFEDRKNRNFAHFPDIF